MVYGDLSHSAKLSQDVEEARASSWDAGVLGAASTLVAAASMSEAIWAVNFILERMEAGDGWQAGEAVSRGSSVSWTIRLARCQNERKVGGTPGCENEWYG